jgi:heme A synthase
MSTLLRVMIGLQTLAAFLAPVTAGLLLTSPSGHALHSASAYTLFTVAVVHVVVAVLAWRPGGGSPKPILYAAVFLALTLAQVALGIAHVKTVHVPLGVLMFGFSLLQLSRVRARPQPPECMSSASGTQSSSGSSSQPWGSVTLPGEP